MKVNWIKFPDYNNEHETIPYNVPVWVYDSDEKEVDIGYWFDGWWETVGKGDVAYISHWAFMDKPEVPE